MTKFYTLFAFRYSGLSFYFLIHDLLDGAVGVVEQALNLERAQVRDVIAGNAVVIAQIPLALELDDAVVGSPTYDGVEDDALIGERSVRIIADGIAEEVAVASRVREIILAIVFVHPRSLEETMWIACLHRLWPSGAGHPCRE